MNALRHCLNPKVLAALAAIGIAAFILAPQAATAILPFLLIAACPLSMILMMKTMDSKTKNTSSSCNDGSCQKKHKTQ